LGGRGFTVRILSKNTVAAHEDGARQLQQARLEKFGQDRSALSMHPSSSAGALLVEQRSSEHSDANPTLDATLLSRYYKYKTHFTSCIDAFTSSQVVEESTLPVLLSLAVSAAYTTKTSACRQKLAVQIMACLADATFVTG
jgi:hypothetical protein